MWYEVEISLFGGQSIYVQLPVDDLRRLENDWPKARRFDETVPLLQTFQGRKRFYRLAKTEEGKLETEETGYKSKAVHVDLTEVVAIEVTEVVEGDDE